MNGAERGIARFHELRARSAERSFASVIRLSLKSGSIARAEANGELSEKFDWFLQIAFALREHRRHRLNRAVAASARFRGVSYSFFSSEKIALLAFADITSAGPSFRIAGRGC